MRIWSELRRRKVIRTAIAYAVVAWLLLQVANVLVPALNLPEWAVRLVTLLLILGFPFAIVLSWLVEPARPHESAVQAPAPSVEAFRPSTPVADTATPPSARDSNRPSIAVLPFADLSQAHDQEYFADGLAEELLNLLTRVADLRVIARTSSFAFKGKDAKIADIARELDVSHVLEGSVRKAQERLRVTAQLVRASDSSHVWSQTFDRDLTDVFAVQDEIARSVTERLRDSLLPAGVSQTRPDYGSLATTKAHSPLVTANSTAYNDYLLGRFHASRRTGDAYALAIERFRNAVALDAAFAPAWAGLGWVLIRQADHGYVPAKSGFEAGRVAVNRALALEPDLADAHTAMSWIHIAFDWDWPAAEREVMRALAIEPGNADALMTLGVLQYTLARHDDAHRTFHASLARDPLRPTTHHFLGRNGTNSGRLADAEAAFRRELELDPGRGAAHLFLGRVLLYQGRLDEALREVELERDRGWGLLGRAMCLHTAGDDAGSRRALEDLERNFGDESMYQIAEAHAWRGELDQAFHWLELAYERRDGGLGDIVGAPSCRSLVDDPRYADILRRVKLPG